MMSGIPNPINQMNDAALGIWSPKRSVIIDMIMVQLISLIVLKVL